MVISNALIRQGLFGLIAVVPTVLVFATDVENKANTEDAANAFYITVDADGKIRHVAKDTATMPITKPASASAVQGVVTPKRDTPVAKALVANTDTSITKTDTFKSEEFINSEYLEQQQFNLDKKKRFYTIPDGNGKQLTIERESGLDLKQYTTPSQEVLPIETIAGQYQVLGKDQVIDLLGVKCVSSKQLHQAKVLKMVPLGVWPQKSINNTLNSNIVRLEQSMTNIQLLSFASSLQSPSYYWPLVVYLNDDGCVMAGVNRFYQSTKPATSISYSALQGNLLVPEGARYLMLTPLQHAPDLNDVTLVEKGQVQLKVIVAQQ